jgi:hypothetical protein
MITAVDVLLHHFKISYSLGYVLSFHSLCLHSLSVVSVRLDSSRIILWQTVTEGSGVTTGCAGLGSRNKGQKLDHS